MRDIKPVGQISIQGATTITNCLNDLSSRNLKLVAEDCKEHWYEGGQFFYPRMSNRGTLTQELGGHFFLSDGSLHRELFDAKIYDSQPYNHYVGQFNVSDWLYGLKFFYGGQSQTVKEFLAQHKMTRKDIFCYVMFHYWSQYNPDDEEYEWLTKHEFLMAKVNPSVADDEDMTEDLLERLFVFENNRAVQVYPSLDGKYFFVGFKLNVYESDDLVPFDGAFSVSEYSGKRLVSSAQMNDPEAQSSQYLYGNNPTNVFYSWMRAPMTRRWPSPYENQNR